MAGKLLVRADADGRMGIGHVMRCVALAHAWRAAGGQATFVTCCPVERLRQRIRASVADLRLLDRAHPHPADLDAMLALLAEARSQHPPSGPTWVVLDGYHFDSAYQRAIRTGGGRLLVVDDVAQLKHFHAEVLLNQNAGAEQLDYVCDPDTTLLLGCRYALLRPEFQAWQSWRRKTPEIARKLLVTLGGADPDNVTRKVIRALERLDLPGCEAKVVVGSANPHLGSLREQIRHLDARIELLVDAANMPELMAWADLAVSAAGTTCWELARMQLPAVVLVLADNQEQVAARLAEAHVVHSLGRSRQLTPGMIAESLSALGRDRSRRATQSEAGRRLVDGCGARRVVAVMEALDGPLRGDQIDLRLVAAEDVMALWRLANDPVVRRNALCTAAIPLDEHLAWFRRKLADPATRIWVLAFQGLVLAVIRYDRTEPNTAEISFSVAAGFRCRGLGTRLLEETCPRAGAELRVDRLRAIVRRENVPSARVFAKAGFVMVDSRPVKDQACHVFERTVAMNDTWRLGDSGFRVQGSALLSTGKYRRNESPEP